MIAFLRGILVSLGNDHAVVAVGGVGFQVSVPASVAETLGAVGQEVTLHTTLLVRDEEPSLYGFPTPQGKRLFDALLAVSGVGPRLALAILSAFSPDEAAVAIVSGNADLLSSVRGVGKRTAGRIVLDLQARLQKEWEAEGVTPMDANADVMAALQALGYSVGEAQRAAASLKDVAGLPLEEQVRQALQGLARE
ncbi:MAG: Holliday junction branch migration protein RuvA [Chloroflexi bacterium]|nr:Holliday junction branch migration protein RuvA [Chloroflexota bacterium]